MDSSGTYELAEPTNPRRLGSYEILHLIARGGMAELFLARHIGPEGFAKLVVLKKVLPRFATNAQFVQLFLDEARLVAGLHHPHIAHVHDMGTAGGDYFFTMEYVHGQDVRSIMNRSLELGRSVPIEHVVLICSTVAGALHYAHELRNTDGLSLDIVHRDVSPSNILISYDGTVKLVDFGVAKAATSTTKTRTGAIKGKIAYMSPEQASGFLTDRRSDVFSLGIVLWEMVTGQRLFAADNDLLTIQRVVNAAPPPPSLLRPDCPPELERIILRALARTVDARYQTAEELQVELEDLARELKLNQSSVSLRSHIQMLFATELDEWEAAQASGISLAEHVGNHPELTRHLEASEVYLIDGETEYAMPTILRPDSTPLPVAQWPAIPAAVASGTTPENMRATITHQVQVPLRRSSVRIVIVALACLVVVFALIIVRTTRSKEPQRAAPATAVPEPEPVRMPVSEPPPVASPPVVKPTVPTVAPKPPPAVKTPVRKKPVVRRPKPTPGPTPTPETRKPWDPNDPLPP